jgi:FkbM family methyltransferase
LKTLDIINPGDLVFDVGAHEGKKTDGYLARGAKVVAFEPQPVRAAQLRERVTQLEGLVRVEQCALGAAFGMAPMLICEESDTISTLDPKWKTGRFKHMAWEKQIDVEVSTLDEMIARYGRPAFVKVDVEGYEKQVLAGLSSAVPCMSIEFAVEFIEDTALCLAKMTALGFREWNFGTFEGDSFVLDEWLTEPDAVLKGVRSMCGGDIYGRV